MQPGVKVGAVGDDSMSRDHVGHRDILRFAEERVNLPQDKALEYRAQAKRLRDKLEGYVGEHADFTLRKMILSGSLAKGTALRSLNDIDVACYIRVGAVKIDALGNVLIQREGGAPVTNENPWDSLLKQ